MHSDYSRRQFYSHAQALLAEHDSARKHWENESNNVQALMDEVARLKVENAGLKTGYQAYEQVNAELKAENEALRLRCDRLDEDKQSMTETHVLYTWLRKKCDQPTNDYVAVQMNIGHDWVPVHDLDRDLRSMIEREEP
ncbi:hypothetical protein CKQ80_23780 [Pseudomonas moraviensis]|uniref:Uncharacterized protein n=2 Tax=Pseudomonas moraviensis TaxID=321662 RepID=A0A2A2PRX8_9PSED|nr:hypothetical protein CKQ68_05430 [Pseudomonas moraviensis]PAW58200.1 hypothetical protein CKQ80_23780 [Pseudomonas moraviensis]